MNALNARRPALSLGLVLSLALSAANALATTYKWVDANGKVHYSSTPPPGGVAYQEIDKSGRVIRSVDSFTEQQRKRAEEQRQQETRQTELDRQRRDRALLATYTSEAEIDRQLARALEQERLQLESTEQQLRQVKKNLEEIDKRIRATPNPGPVLLQQQAEARELLLSLEERLKRQRASIELTRARFEADKARYRELTTRAQR